MDQVFQTKLAYDCSQTPTGVMARCLTASSMGTRCPTVLRALENLCVNGDVASRLGILVHLMKASHEAGNCLG